MGKLRFKFKVDVPDKNTEKIIKDSFMNFISDISKLTDKPVTVKISNKSEFFEEKVEDKIDNELNKVADNNDVEYLQDTRMLEEEHDPYFDSQYFIFKVYGKEIYLSLTDMFSMNDKPMLIFTREKFKFNDEKTAIGYFEDYTHAKIVNISKSELEKYDKEYMIIEIQHYANDKLIETKYFRGGESKEEETEEEVDTEPVIEETKPEFIYIIKEGDKYINKITDLIRYTYDIGRALVFDSRDDAYKTITSYCYGANRVSVDKGEAAKAQISGYTVFEIRFFHLI